MSCILAIDTSSSRLVLALGVKERVFEMEPECADDLDSIDKSFLTFTSRQGVAVADISKVVVGNGPGSFTGLRIGYGFAKGLCLACRIPLFSVSTFMACAIAALANSATVAVISDARRQEVFLGIYRRGEKERCPATILSPCIIRADEIRSVVAQACGDSAEYTVITPLLSALPVPIAEEYGVMDSAQFGRGLILAGLDSEAHFSPEALMQEAPNYVRRPAAKTIAERKAGL